MFTWLKEVIFYETKNSPPPPIPSWKWGFVTVRQIDYYLILGICFSIAFPYKKRSLQKGFCKQHISHSIQGIAKHFIGGTYTVWDGFGCSAS